MNNNTNDPLAVQERGVVESNSSNRETYYDVIDVDDDSPQSNNNNNNSTSSSTLSPMEIELKPLVDDELPYTEVDYSSDDDEYDTDNIKNSKKNHHQRRQHIENVTKLSILSPSSLVSKSSWNEFLYPSNVPVECQLLRKENIAIPACYLLVGILQGLSGPLMNVYPLDLNATEAQQTSIGALRSLPASCKLIFGFISDNFPLGGYRRKSYMLLGWFLSSMSFLILIYYSDTSFNFASESSDYDQSCSITGANTNAVATTTVKEDTTTTTNTDDFIPINAPSIGFLSLMVFGFGFGMWFADVMGDSLVAEKAKLETVECRGSIQSSCYAYRFFGSMIASPLSTYLYNKYGPNYVFYILATLPLLILPLVCNLREEKNIPIASTRTQCNEIYKTVCSRAVWQPMGFVYLYNVLQVGNSAWRQFLKTGLHFSSCQLNLLYILANILVYLGIIAYKYYMIHWSWRNIYILTTLLNALFSTLQILLILQITFGVSNFLFALGDDVFLDFIAGIQFLPTTIMMVQLCPSGSEGASYAMFTTVSNSAGTLSSSISTMLLPIWDVSKSAIERLEWGGILKLTLLTTAVQTSGILFVKWLPHHKEELEDLKKGNNNTSSVGGIIFLTITFMSITNAIVTSVLNIVAPGWMGES